MLWFWLTLYFFFIFWYWHKTILWKCILFMSDFVNGFKIIILKKIITINREIEQHKLGGSLFECECLCVLYVETDIFITVAKHTCGCVSSVCADITIVVVLCILSSWSTGDFGGWLIIRSAFALLSDTCVPKANDSAARTMSRTWKMTLNDKKTILLPFLAITISI